MFARDFNTEPIDVPYKLVRRITPLIDAWEDCKGSSEGGETCDIPTNSFAHEYLLRKWPNGKRIDYIMYQPGPNMKARTVQCSLPLPSRIVGKDPYRITLALNGHSPVKAECRAPGVGARLSSTTPETIELTLEGPENGTVEWSVSFDRE